jgi:hypothetical protein
VQVVCNHKSEVIAVCVGWAGSVPDIAVWEDCGLWKRRETFFERTVHGGEYLLADKGAYHRA